MRRALGLAAVLAAGCLGEDFAVFDPGLHLKLRVQGGQVVRGDIPKDEGGPAVTDLQRQEPEVQRGDAGVAFSGRLGPGGTAIRIQRRGDRDHWIIRADTPDDVARDELLWSAPLEFSYDIQESEVIVLTQAVDEKGRGGPIRETSFTVLPDPPASKLSIALGWDAAVDLDLHVLTPSGVVVGAKNINSYEPPPPGSVDPPDAWMSGGWLELDSNMHCVLDRRQVERVIWTTGDPPLGTYRVYADLFSPCDEHAVSFVTVVHRNGEVIEGAGASLYAFDARVHPTSGEAPGLLLLEFEVR